MNNARELLCVEFTGNQYINTVLTTDGSTGFYLDFIPLTPISANTNFYLSSNGTGRFRNTLRLSLDTLNTYSGGRILRTSSNILNAKLNIGNRQVFSLIDNVITYPDGTQDTLPATTFSGQSLYIGDSRIIPSSGAGTSMKLYRCKIYQNQNVILDLVPAMRLSDNAVGLYDNMNNQFFENLGSSPLLYEEMPIPPTPTPTDNPTRRVGRRAIIFRKRKYGQ